MGAGAHQPGAATALARIAASWSFKHMGELEAFFHYRNVDVSTIRAGAPLAAGAAGKFTKSGSHQALDDIRESIAELQFYRSHVFKI